MGLEVEKMKWELVVRKEIQRKRNWGWYLMSNLIHRQEKEECSRQKEQHVQSGPGQSESSERYNSVGLKHTHTHTYVGSVAATHDTVVKSIEHPAMTLGLGFGSAEN